MITKEEIMKIVDQNQQEAIDCLVELIQTPSISGEEVAVSKVFSKWIERIGITPQIVGITEDHPNVLGEWCGSRTGKRFIFNGHMDTFPPNIGVKSIYPPFSGMVSDGYIWGRGARDMKGGDAAALMAVAFLKRLGFDPKGSILLSYMCDEEIGGRYGVKWMVEQGYLDGGEFGICMEPTAGRILLGHTGVFRMYVTYTGFTGVSSKPHPSKDALEKSICAIQALYQYRDDVVMKRHDDFYGTPAMNITTLSAESASNVWAPSSTFAIDRRIISVEDYEQVTAEIFAILDRLKELDPEMEYTYELISDRPKLEVPEDSPIVTAGLEAFEEITGRKGTTYYRRGGSDAANIYHRNGLHIPNWGAAEDNPTDGFGGGQPNERIPIVDYLDSIKYYMLTVVKLMS